MNYALPKLSYAYDALEPFIDAKTMEIHYTKHHQTYIDKLNAALTNYEELQHLTLEELLHHDSELPAEVEAAIRNNGGGHYNHSLFWSVMKPKASGGPQGELSQKIEQDFGSLAEFKEQFTQVALTRFGSGWAWLTVEEGKLHVCSTPNQDSPIMQGNMAILGLDVWEHAYYLKYQNRRPDYIENWWNVVSWNEVSARLQQALSQ